jgi:hypothetical protein
MALILETKKQKSTYAAVHMWMRYHHGKPQKCENCETTEKRMYHWANVSGTYKREREDWLRLCVPCHKSNDIKALGGKIKARPKKVQPTKICTECGNEFFKNPHLSRKQWEAAELCSLECSIKRTGRKLKGTKQSEQTKALKSKLLKERWATNEQWREHVTKKMIGNQFARKTEK